MDQIFAVLERHPWLQAALERLAALQEPGAPATAPDWFGHLVRATLTPCSPSDGCEPQGGWTLSRPLLGTTMVPELRGRILGYRIGREYYAEPYRGRPALGLFRAPDCQSADGREGRGHAGANACDACPLRHRQSGRPQCRSRGYLLLLTEESPDPVLVLVPRTSLGVVKQLRTDLRAARDMPLGQWVVHLGSRPHVTAHGRVFPRLQLTGAAGFDGSDQAWIGRLLEGAGRGWFELLRQSLVARQLRSLPAEARSA